MLLLFDFRWDLELFLDLEVEMKLEQQLEQELLILALFAFFPVVSS
jgi:hypothetical protein